MIGLRFSAYVGIKEIRLPLSQNLPRSLAKLRFIGLLFRGHFAGPLNPRLATAKAIVTAPNASVGGNLSNTQKLGGGLSRIHVRNVEGFVFLSHAPRLAHNGG